MRWDYYCMWKVKLSPRSKNNAKITPRDRWRHWYKLVPIRQSRLHPFEIVSFGCNRKRHWKREYGVIGGVIGGIEWCMEGVISVEGSFSRYLWWFNAGENSLAAITSQCSPNSSARLHLITYVPLPALSHWTTISWSESVDNTYIQSSIHSGSGVNTAMILLFKT